jgi:hypothetical protein
VPSLKARRNGHQRPLQETLMELNERTDYEEKDEETEGTTGG